MDDVKIERRMLGACAVYIGEDLLKDILPYFRNAFENGALLCLYDTHLKGVADNVMYELKKGGYRIFAFGVPSKRSADEWNIDVLKQQIPEYARYILAIGSGSVVSVAKGLSECLQVEWSLVWSAPSIDTILCGNQPKQVFIDTNLMIKCPIDCLAAGWGCVFSSHFTSFENIYSHKILAQPTTQRKTHYVERDDIVALAFALLEMSFEKSNFDSADLLAGIMYNGALAKGKKPRLFGEYKFLSSVVLTKLYQSFLSAPSIDIIPPPSICEHLDRLKQLCNVKNGVVSNCIFDFDSTSKNTALCKKVDYLDIDTYFKVSYVISEYRMDLIDNLSSCDLNSTQRYWRRLYNDAGYWLRSEINSTTLLKYLSLAGAVSDNLLGYMYASGVMTNF